MHRSLREHVAGQTAMCAVVSAQADAPPRSTFQRIIGVSPLTPESRRSYRGALGELVVGDILENLGPVWDVLHDLPLGARLLEHLVIGPAGVCAVRAVNATDADVVVDGDQFIVGGDPRSDIPESIEDASTTARFLATAAQSPVRVQPLLVVVDPTKLTVKRPASGVRIVASSDLHRFLARAARTLTGEDVARISDLADLQSTWPSGGSDRLDTQKLHRDFTVIRADVRTALARRIGWSAAGIGLLYGLVWGVIATLVGTIMAS